MSLLKLTVRRPGNLLSRLLEADITAEQYAQIVLILSDPDRWVIAERPPAGFRHPADPRSEVTTPRAVASRIVETIRRHNGC